MKYYGCLKGKRHWNMLLGCILTENGGARVLDTRKIIKTLINICIFIFSLVLYPRSFSSKSFWNIKDDLLQDRRRSRTCDSGANILASLFTVTGPAYSYFRCRPSVCVPNTN
jgi:hypothetical protein